ncbi:MAG: 3-isopropylmalate dehydratase [Candidatus Aegiribacteria sp.]|nr:3-isopropylmalate dehydratase [Candidatus Aegiribacteria sp.]MBD3294067.1 3-isopropylmalate dehydratase [Candidatus Fermentibacteria bacterium]
MKVHHYPQDDINTDLLFPGKYTYTCSTGPEIKEHLLEDLDPDFAECVEPGDVIISGENFGCGSSREQPSLGLRHVGLKAVIAKSFARIFYRSAINQGLLLVQSPEAVEAYREGDEVEVDPASGMVKVGETEFGFPPLPDEMLEILEDGGLLNHIKKEFASKEEI